MSRISVFLLVVGWLVSPLWGQPREWSDDFMSAATYDNTSLLAPCYGATISTKYSVMELQTGDIFNERAVSGSGELSVNNRVLGAATSPFRLEGVSVGVVNAGQGCTDVAGIPLNYSSESFTSPELCVYSGHVLSPWQVRGTNDLDGSDDRGGAPNFDDDSDGTSDEFDESLALVATTGNGGYGPPFPGGPDGGPGNVGVDDDGNGVIDDVGETAWPGSDDGDDNQGYQTWHVAMRVSLGTSTAIYAQIEPHTGEAWSFVFRELINLVPRTVELANELSPNFYQENTRYGHVFCNSGTCYGALLWTETDIANPAETLGPVANTLHSGPIVGFLNEHGASGDPEYVGAYVRQNRWLGNPNFSDTFWIISGNPMQYPYFPSLNEDLDGDKDVDGNDFLTFSLCYNGALRPPQSGCANLDADLDGDGDVDGFDFTTWSLCHNGSLTRPQPSCMPPILTSCP